jgi:S1-C subfamily serine protease
MKKSLLFILLSVIAANLFAQADFATVHMVVGRGAYGINLPYTLYINDHLAVNANSLDIINMKVYSKGVTSFTVLFTNGKTGGSVDIKENKDYYLMCKPFSFNITVSEVEKEKFFDFAKGSKKTLDLEEDINKPWGKIDETKRTGKGQGTCFVISANGYLITNHHVIEGAKEITVTGIDADFTTKYGASLVADDPSNDLALLKIGNKNVKFNIPPFAIRSSGVAQAEKVYCLGFPAAEAMGQEVKITEGIISAKSGVGNDISKFQISAAVNHGNSGGPLIDDQGNLIGVIYAKSTIAESAGYAIKASYLETFLKNVDGFELPAFTNTIKDKTLPEKTAALKNFIFIVETN